jgi:hypothetical protein
MIDSIYKTAQSILNKDQLGYFKPMDYNLFIRIAVRKYFNSLRTELKSDVRKMNWMLDGKDLANLSEHTRQLAEYFSFEAPIAVTTNFVLPDDVEFVEDVFTGTQRIDKVHYSDYMDLQASLYASPSSCAPICTKVGGALKVSPNTITDIELHYLRSPKIPNWTYIEFEGKAMYDPTANDFQDVDLPNDAEDKLTSMVVEMASQSIRDAFINQSENQNQAQEAQEENKQ